MSMGLEKNVPSVMAFVNGPAFIDATEDKADFLHKAAESIEIQERKWEKQHNTSLDYMETESESITGNDFLKLRHPETKETIEEKYPQLITLIAEKHYVPSLTSHFVLLVQEAVKEFGCDLCSHPIYGSFL